MYAWCTNSQELRESGNVGLYPTLLISLFVYCKFKEMLQMLRSRDNQNMWRVIVM
jgi:hypothetical protein